MIQVSDSFKKAIKSDTRQIYGYVDMEFDAKDKDYYVVNKPLESILSMTDGSDLIDQNKKMINYGTLENNYFLLDGSFKLANTTIRYNSGGFMSEDIYQDITTPTFTIEANTDGEIETPGISIYFKDNLAIDFIINILDMEDNTTSFNIINNNNYNYFLIFDEPIIIKSISLNILRVEYNDRRLRIPEISLTPSDIYEGNELISFTINEEIDISNQTTPINTCTININNYPDYEGGNLFDPINPKGLTKYLTENTQIKPYVGILTEDEGVEYVAMGVYYLSDWSSDVDGNVTLKGQDIMGVFKNKPTISKPGILTTYKSEDIENLLKSEYNIEFLPGSTYFESNMELLKNINIFDWFAAYNNVIWDDWSDDDYIYINLFKADRYNRIYMSTYGHYVSSNNIPENYMITRNMMLQDAEFVTNSIPNTIEISYIKPWHLTSDTKEYSLNTTYTLTKTEEYVWLSLEKFTSDGTFSYTKTANGTATLIDYNDYTLYVKLNGAIGETFTLKYYGWVYNDPPSLKKIYTNNISNGEKISIDTTKYIFMNDDAAYNTAQYYLKNTPKYNIKFESIGLPHFEVNDSIYVQTRYSNEYKLAIITKQQITYDGGVVSSIEGISY